MTHNKERTTQESLNNLRCDLVRVEDYLSDAMNAEQQAEFEAHLSTCVSCRNAVQEQAAAPEVWQNATRLLGKLGNDIDPTDEPNETQEVALDQQPIGSVVLDALAPSDDPGMLGRMGEYEISGVIGVGGMGAVLRGFDKSLRRVVAIKVLSPHLAGSGPGRNRFQREARAAAAITHDNVIDIYGVSEFSGLPYLVMPYARGPSLQSRIDHSGPMTGTEVVRVGRQIASGLAAAHEQGLVHRDIKPANILLNEGIERLWITDFGVARAIDDASMTQTGLIAGTPQFMSPEQARGEFVDHRSDLFSMGSVLYTACTGRPPFRSEAAYGVLRRITDTDPRPIREINPDIPDWLCKIIQRLMAKHPADRYQTAAEVADLFDGCIAHLQQPTKINLPACVGTTSVTVPREHSTAAPDRNADISLGQTKRGKRGLIMMLSLVLSGAVGLLAMHVTNPPDVSGVWAGEHWQDVKLQPVSATPGWYDGTFADAEGKQGAVHLQWSRVHRRFNGRWQMGEDTTGVITLRSKQSGQVAGAISVDSEASLETSAPRLREFSWRRVAGRGLIDPDASISSVNDALPIRTPVKGVIVKIDESLTNNSHVAKEQVIAVIGHHECKTNHRASESRRKSRNQIGITQAAREGTAD